MPPADLPATRPPRRWLRVSLRASMILVVVIAIPSGWVASTIRAQRRAIEAVRAAGGAITFDWQREPVGTAPNGRPAYRKEPAAPAWLRRWLGDELFESVLLVRFPGRSSPEALAALDRFGRLEELRLGDATGVGDGLRHLRALKRLETVWLAGPGITDAMLGDLARIPSIRTLSIGRPLSQAGRLAVSPGASPTDAGFAHLASLPNLAGLTVEDCPNLTDAGLSRLVEGLPALRAINLVGGPRSLALAIPALARRHPDLDTLGLHGTGVRDADLAVVAGLARLRFLRLGQTAISAAGLANLRGMKSLSSLMATGTATTDAGLEAIGTLTGLGQLFLSETKVTDAGLVHLAGLKGLKRLDLNATGVTDAGMPTLANLTSLETLWMSRTRGLTDAGLIPLRGLTNLQQLEVSGTKVTPQGAAALRRAVPTLRVITTTPRRAASGPPAAPAAK